MKNWLYHQCVHKEQNESQDRQDSIPLAARGHESAHERHKNPLRPTTKRSNVAGFFAESLSTPRCSLDERQIPGDMPAKPMS